MKLYNHPTETDNAEPSQNAITNRESETEGACSGFPELPECSIQGKKFLFILKLI